MGQSFEMVTGFSEETLQKPNGQEIYWGNSAQWRAQIICQKKSEKRHPGLRREITMAKSLNISENFTPGRALKNPKWDLAYFGNKKLKFT
jgi:hypothetical protein